MSRLTYRSAKNLDLYRQAFRHTSASDQAHESNERLELLGDSVLDLVAAEYLFFKYPYKDEGFLTEVRSKMVNRKQLNEIGKSMKLESFIESSLDKKQIMNSSALGNALEALVGAYYLDHGYAKSKRYVAKRIFDLHIDMDKLIEETTNFKSAVIHHAQKNGYQFDFQTEVSDYKKNQFKATFSLDGVAKGEGFGFSKKQAEQAAAQQAYAKLNLGDR